MKNKQTLNQLKKSSGKQNQVLCPNCSEMVFRLTGDLEEIRTQMYNILEWTRKEYTGEVGGGDKETIHPTIQKNMDEVKRLIKEAKSLDDFEKIIIEFTCNYETFFKVDENDNGLLVATCNNYTWDDVEHEEVYEDNIDYYSVAGYTSYKLYDTIEGYPIFKLEYHDEDHKKFPMFIFPDKNQEFRDEFKEEMKIEKGGCVKFVIRNDIMYKMEANHLVKVKEINDKVLLNKIKILANLGGFD